jgi:hypothetical protein
VKKTHGPRPFTTPSGHLLTNEVDVYLHMFSLLMMRWVLREVDDRYVVTVHDACFVNDNVQLQKKLS